MALGKLCKNFNPVNYERLLTAYRYLGKTEIALDQLIIHFMTAINHASFSVILENVEVCLLLVPITIKVCSSLHFRRVSVQISMFWPRKN